MYCRLLLDYFLCLLCWQFSFAGRITEEKLLRRYEDTLDEGDVDSEGRPRRQLPTEINIQVTAPLFTARLYDYGDADGDKQVPASVDVGMRLPLTHPILFFGQKYKEIYILSNGGIGFEQNSRNYKNNIVKTGPAIIAPLWNRNDLRKGGQIFYREITEGRAVERAQSEVRYQYDKNVKPISVILVTWVNMQPNGDQTISVDNTNTVQMAIINTENSTYANLIYKNIGWSQGAEAGFGKGDGQSYYSMPSSGTDNIMYLKDYGNTGIPGEWIFEIGQEKIIRCKPGIKGDTCDDECAEFEWGPDCANCCRCAKGRCNVQTGECNGNECKQCWNNPPLCNKREPDCKARQKDCGFNAISFTDFDRCGEPMVRCQCLTGYVGDGFNCTDVDECTTKRPCHQHALCINTPGRYYCECEPGYTGNGTLCTAIITQEPIIITETTTGFNKTRRPTTVKSKTDLVETSSIVVTAEQQEYTEPLDEEGTSTLDKQSKNLQQFFESATSLNIAVNKSSSSSSSSSNISLIPLESSSISGISSSSSGSSSITVVITSNTEATINNVTLGINDSIVTTEPSKHESDFTAITSVNDLPSTTTIITLLLNTSQNSNSLVSVLPSTTLLPETSSTLPSSSFEDDDFSSISFDVFNRYMRHSMNFY